MNFDYETFWVYAIDEWDARDQIARTLKLDVHNERRFDCAEAPNLRLELDVIVHRDGTRTGIVRPPSLDFGHYDRS
ncbi:hypothetical protein [Beijerinckia sp. L45]|uniref:hypothetical protein n=1 Tax=Beijerinckia sp. L45 TaxID=1641855 RepID=UPI00131B9C67|nr:hypothetical protein [Beijerinckia sp. L45]